jgi:uncharacterized membrane protein (UPF0127 family)
MASFRNYCLSLIFVFFSVCAVNADISGNKCEITIVSQDGKRVKLNAEIALTHAERERGLMFRQSMNEDSGMLFVFEKEQNLNFWMKNTYIPLDIAYIGKNKIINEIYHMKPLDVSLTYNSIKPAMFALEVNLGWFSRHQIKKGSKIELNGCIRKQNSLIKR